LIGNAEYQPPDIITNQGFSSPVDIWALGCIFFFLIEGRSPFADSNTMKMNMKIRQGSVEFGEKSNKASPKFKDLISKLLVVDPSARLTAADVLTHPWINSA